jgi:hypothetical protein
LVRETQPTDEPLKLLEINLDIDMDLMERVERLLTGASSTMMVQFNMNEAGIQPSLDCQLATSEAQADVIIGPRGTDVPLQLRHPLFQKFNCASIPLSPSSPMAHVLRHAARFHLALCKSLAGDMFDVSGVDNDSKIRVELLHSDLSPGPNELWENFARIAVARGLPQDRKTSFYFTIKHDLPTDMFLYLLRFDSAGLGVQVCLH